MPQAKLVPGDLVEVKSPIEIGETLDADGASDHLPFMPEMTEFCGGRFRVSKRVVKTCFSGSMSTMRKFRADDILTLDGVRCSGAAHERCQKACIIFWREAWLRKVEDSNIPPRIEAAVQVIGGLKTRRDAKTFFCQASELLNATDPLSRWERLVRCLHEIRAGNSGTLEMAHRIGTWMFWRLRRAFLGEYAQGYRKSTPAETLDLKQGEWVQVKAMEQIRETLNEKARNRGLYFSPDMRQSCGLRSKVAQRIDRIIVDGTGEMRQLRNTIYLEGSHCGCAHVAFGGCSRSEFTYWREIWVNRVADSADRSV